MECTPEILMNLRDAGCSEELIETYQSIAANSLPEQAICGQRAHLLIDYRKTLLAKLHEDQHRIDCLDHLLYQLKARAGMLPATGKTAE